jgi:hypothetical protein
LVVLGKEEKVSDLPECKNSGAKIDPLARFMEHDRNAKLIVASEENVLGDPNHVRVGDNEVIRLFAKAAYEITGKRPVDPNWEKRGREVQQYELRVTRMDERFDEKLGAAYETARTRNLWRGTGALRDRAEYWSRGVLAYFDAAGQSAAPEGSEHPIITREALREYDPELFHLVAETMAYTGHVDWRFSPVAAHP